MTPQLVDHVHTDSAIPALWLAATSCNLAVKWTCLFLSAVTSQSNRSHNCEQRFSVEALALSCLDLWFTDAFVQRRYSPNRSHHGFSSAFEKTCATTQKTWKVIFLDFDKKNKRRMYSGHLLILVFNAQLPKVNTSKSPIWTSNILLCDNVSVKNSAKKNLVSKTQLFGNTNDKP